MILAAGFGTRLLPFTKLRPKPLFPVLNQPLLLLTIRRLQAAGFTKIIVNCHHLREQIVSALTGISGVMVQEEERILGTGGGLRKALDSLSPEPLLITNGDIYHTVSYRELYKSHLESSAPVTMALHDYPRFNSVGVCDGAVTSFKSGSPSALAFSGLHVINPEILGRLKDGESSCIIELYKKLLADKVTINVHRIDDCFWTDMGTPEDYLQLHAGLLAGVIPCWSQIEQRHEENCSNRLVVGKGTVVPESTVVRNWACLGENVVVAEDISLQGVVVWDGAVLDNTSNYIDVIVAGTGGF